MDFALRVGPVLADPLGPVEGGKHQDVEQFGARAGLRVRRPALVEGIPERPILLAVDQELAECGLDLQR